MPDNNKKPIGFGYIPDKNNVGYLLQKGKSPESKDVQKYLEIYYHKLRSMGPNRKLYLKDWIELDKEIKEEMNNDINLF